MNSEDRYLRTTDTSKVKAKADDVGDMSNDSEIPASGEAKQMDMDTVVGLDYTEGSQLISERNKIAGTSEMKLKKNRLHAAYTRVTVETAEQLNACLGSADLIYIDSGFFDAAEYEHCVDKIHAAGKLAGLRLPYIWRNKAEEYFDRHLEAVRKAGFDIYLFRNTEGLLYFYEQGLLADTPFAADSSLYIFNKSAADELKELIPEEVRSNFLSATLPLELNGRELEKLTGLLHTENRFSWDEDCGAEGSTEETGNTGNEGTLSNTASDDTEEKEKNNKRETSAEASAVEAVTDYELTVYGRAPMMVSAQCINKTVNGCDRKQKQLLLRDRKQAELPVKNCCRFCYNLIYNAVPTMLYDMSETIKHISPDALRFDFTTETAEETRKVMAGIPLPAGSFTRGHLKRGV